MRSQIKQNIFHWTLISFFAIFSGQVLAIPAGGCESLALTTWRGNFYSGSEVTALRMAIGKVQPSFDKHFFQIVHGTINGVSIDNSLCIDATDKDNITIKIVTPNERDYAKIGVSISYKAALKDNDSIKDVQWQTYLKDHEGILTWFLGDLVKN
jgi:hypothetical protein